MSKRENPAELLEGILQIKKDKMTNDLQSELMIKERQLSESILRTSTLKKKIAIIKKKIKANNNFSVKL